MYMACTSFSPSPGQLKKVGPLPIVVICDADRYCRAAVTRRSLRLAQVAVSFPGLCRQSVRLVVQTPQMPLCVSLPASSTCMGSAVHTLYLQVTEDRRALSDPLASPARWKTEHPMIREGAKQGRSESPKPASISQCLVMTLAPLFMPWAYLCYVSLSCSNVNVPIMRAILERTNERVRAVNYPEANTFSRVMRSA